MAISASKVCLKYALPTDRHPCRPPTTIIVFGRCGCHHDELNPTVLKVILVSCATVAAGMSHSQMRHFEGISSPAGVEFYFACGGLRRESRRDNNMIAALVSVMRLPTRRFSRVCRQKLLQPCMAMRAQCSCLQCPMQLLALYHTYSCLLERTVICVLCKTMRHQLRCRKADFEHVLLWFVRRE